MTRKPWMVTLGVALLATTGCQRQGSQATPGAPSAPLSSSGFSGSGGGILQVIAGVVSRLTGSSGTAATASGIGSAGTSFLGLTQGPATAVPSGWQQAVGKAPDSSSSGGGALADPATTSVAPIGGVFRVVATSFWNQDVAGRTVEDGDARLDEGERGMALPSRRGLGRWVAIRYRGRIAYAPVIDVGPVYTDDPYWETGGVPRAASNAGQRRTGPTNEVGGVMQRTGFTVDGQAADLTPATWRDLGATTRQMKDTIEWWFVEEATGVAGFERQRAGQALVA